MAEADPYFQFPLCLLALQSSDDWGTRVGMMANYAIVEFGRANGCFPGGSPHVVKAEKEKSMEALRKGLNLSGGNLDSIVKGWMSANAHVERYLAKFPTSLGLVRMRTDICFKCRDGSGLGERDFRVLAAIYSAIGELPFKQITFDILAHRSAGCVSKKVFLAWSEKAKPYTRKELRKTVDELQAANWFRACLFHRRQKFYSHSLSDEQLRAKVAELKSKRRDPERDKRRQMDEEMTRAILAARQALVLT